MCMMFKPRCNHCSGWGKCLLDPIKEGWFGQSSRCCWLCFLIAKALSNMNLYHVVWWKTVVPGSFSEFEWCLLQKRPELWENLTSMLHHENVRAHALLPICWKSHVWWFLGMKELLNLLQRCWVGKAGPVEVMWVYPTRHFLKWHRTHLYSTIWYSPDRPAEFEHVFRFAVYLDCMQH